MGYKLKYNVVHGRNTGVKGMDGKDIIVHTKVGVVLENPETGHQMQVMHYQPIGCTEVVYQLYAPKPKEPAV